jgi:transposase-like protein
MALVYVHCPECQSIDVVQYGKQANGTQRYRCNNRDCPRRHCQVNAKNCTFVQ